MANSCVQETVNESCDGTWYGITMAGWLAQAKKSKVWVITRKEGFVWCLVLSDEPPARTNGSYVMRIAVGGDWPQQRSLQKWLSIDYGA